MNADFCYHPSKDLTDWLASQHQQGAILSSACSGVFILAETGILENKTITTHWMLKERFKQSYNKISINIEKILINDQDIITAGGLMSWVDLGLELVAQLASPHVMRQLGKILVVDTGLREQRYYQSFSPRLDHGNQVILKAQRYMQSNMGQKISINDLCQRCFTTERTFIRHFVKATGLKPIDYLQRLRIQKASELIESSSHTFNQISQTVGYKDISSFRKVFLKITGLSPGEFRKRFA